MFSCFLLDNLESSQRDIVFLLDGTHDTQSGFPAMKSFVQQVVETLNVGQNTDHVSVVQYSQNPETNFALNTYMTKQDVLVAVKNLNHKGGKPRNTGAALDYVRTNAFSEFSGSRHKKGAPQILLLLSGGKSQDNVETAATSLKQKNVVTFCVGTRTADIIELQMIAHNPSYAFSVLTFDDVGSIQQQLVSFVKRVPQQRQKIKMEEVQGSMEQRLPTQRDIVFLLDSTDEMRSEFKTVVGFVERILDQLNVGENKDRVSVVQYSNEPSADFFLNTHKTKQSVTDNVQALRHKGGRPLNTGAALNYVADEIFAPLSGSRRKQGVPQILILLTGGPSRDDIRNAVVKLKEFRVNTFVVGVKNADMLEMQSVSEEPSKAFLVADSSNMADIEQKIVLAIEKSENSVKTSGLHGKNCSNAIALFDTLPASLMRIMQQH
ncbi:collagen alpha-3(VI) chain [Oryzias melastigma]|uniref:collagen alpha-3(VI) chain n=1 Tax=Oryzias melastigma TaxID=30732 RepID=UPI00168CFB25|nr:collagen alpha-3(VI) chain [Oryzias melastigma]